MFFQRLKSTFLIPNYIKKKFHFSGSLFDFLYSFLQQFSRDLRSTDPTNEDWAKNKRIFEEVSKELKGLKIRFKRPGIYYRPNIFQVGDKESYFWGEDIRLD